MNAQATHTTLLGITAMLRIVRDNGDDLSREDRHELASAIECINTVTNHLDDQCTVCAIGWYLPSNVCDHCNCSRDEAARRAMQETVPLCHPEANRRPGGQTSPIASNLGGGAK